MSFPDADLPLLFSAAFGANPAGSPGGWAFQDLTSRLIDNVAIVDSVNRRVSSSVCNASNTSISLNNDDAELTPLRAMSSKWPNVVRDVPCKLQLRRADDTFTRSVSNGWGTSDSGHMWTTAGGVASAYSTSGTQGSVSVSATGSDRITLVNIGGPHQDVRITATTNGTPTGGTIETGVVARYADASNFYIAAARVSTGGAVTAVIAKRVAGVLSDVATVATGLSTGTSKRLRFRVHNDRLQLKVWLTSAAEPDTWQLDVFDTSLAVGDSAGSFSRRNTGNLTPTTFTYDNFDTSHTIRAGHADAWNTDINPNTGGAGQETCITRVTFSGPIRRLTKGAKPLRSPLYRSLTNVDGEFIPLAYVPMEDRAGATQFAPGLIGGNPMTFTGTVTPESEASLAGSSALPEFGSSGRAEVPLPAYTDTGFWLAVAIVFIPTSLSSATNLTLLSVQTNGPTIGTFTLFMNPSIGEFGVTRYSPNGSVIASTSTGWDASSGSAIGRWTFITLTCRKDYFGTDDHIQANLLNLNPTGANFGSFGENIGTTGYGQAVRAGLNGAVCPAPSGGEGIAYGHLWLMTNAQFDVTGDTRDYVLPALAHIGETAAARARRLSLEEGVPISIAPGDTVRMGPQLIDTYFSNVALCATSDQGILTEDEFALSFIPRAARYNRPVSMTINLATYRHLAGEAAPVMRATYDDAEFLNEWQIVNANGSEANYADNTVTPLRHDGAEQVSLYNDTELLQHAVWRTGLSSFDTHRYPDTPVSLTANPGLIGAWLGAASGMSRIVRTGIPAKGPDGDIDEILASYSQRILPNKWEAVYTGSPAAPYRAAVLGDANLGKADSGSSSLTANISTGATSFQVTTANPRDVWTTDAAQLPITLRIGGEDMTIPAGTGSISGASSPQTFSGVVRSVNGVIKTHTAGTPVHVKNPARLAL